MSASVRSVLLRKPTPEDFRGALVLLGWLWALPNTVVGLVLALLGGFRFVRVVGPERALVFYVRPGSPLGWFFRAYKLGPGEHIGAQTHGLIILMEPGDDSPATVVHERTHVRQQLKLGVLFYVAYLFFWLRLRLAGDVNAYRDDPFEAEAYAAQAAFEKGAQP